MRLQNLSRDEVDSLKATYPQGTKIKLILMRDDPRPMEPGAEGVVSFVDDLGTIHMNWDNGRTIGLIPNVDKWEVLPTDSKTLRI